MYIGIYGVDKAIFRKTKVYHLNLCKTAFMKHLKITLFAIVAMGSVATASAQAKKKFKGKPIEAGFTLGGSNYFGDLSKTVAIGETHLMGGLICRFQYNDFLTLRGNAVYGAISGDDKNFKDDIAFTHTDAADAPIEITRGQRNLNFRSDILEFSAIGEWNLLGYEESTRTRPYTPFLFAGIGVYKFNPKTQFFYMDGVRDATGALIHNAQLQQFDGQWIELQTLSTEGQETTKFNDRKRYNLTQVSIPLGVGFKQQVDDYWAYGIEFGVRKTFTDYLDDVSIDYLDDQIVGGANGYLAAAMKDRSSELTNPNTGLPYERFYMGNPRGSMKGSDYYMFLNFTLTRKIMGGKTVCFQF